MSRGRRQPVASTNVAHQVSKIYSRQETGRIDCALATSSYRIEIAHSALDDPANVTGDPAAVEVARLWLDLLTVHIAVPGPGVEREIALEGRKGTRRRVV